MNGRLRAGYRGESHPPPSTSGWTRRACIAATTTSGVLLDQDSGVVLEVTKGRGRSETQKMLKATIDKKHRAKVKTVCMDMWKPFMKAAAKLLPKAVVIHDRFHISKHLGEAVDKTRRAENKKLRKVRNDALTGTRYLFLRNFDRLKLEQLERFFPALEAATETATAWKYKELFRHFWELTDIAAARKYLANWYWRARKERLPHLRRVADTILRHVKGLLTYTIWRHTNSLSENMNSKIQQLKTIAKGFRTFANYRLNILFHFGGLDMNPLKSQ